MLCSNFINLIDQGRIFRFRLYLLRLSRQNTSFHEKFKYPTIRL